MELGKSFPVGPFLCVESDRVTSLISRSFAGFYYVAVTDANEDGPASMSGFYFHPNSEP
jgi:hypothetical protein